MVASIRGRQLQRVLVIGNTDVDVATIHTSSKGDSWTCGGRTAWVMPTIDKANTIHIDRACRLAVAIEKARRQSVDDKAGFGAPPVVAAEPPRAGRLLANLYVVGASS